MKLIFLSSILFCCFTGALSGTEPERPWNIQVGPGAAETELFAAEELRNALKQILNTDFPIIRRGDSGAVIIGTPVSHPEIARQQPILKLDPASDRDQIAVFTLNGKLVLAGNRPGAALQAVYTFLREIMGCRWLWPGKTGVRMPRRNNFSLPELSIRRDLAFRYRGWHWCGYGDSAESELWMVRNGGNFMRSVPRHGTEALNRRRKQGIHLMFSTHNAVLDKKYFRSNPEMFALVKGKRDVRQACWSNAEAETIMVEDFARMIESRPDLEVMSIFPGDVRRACECPECRKLDWSSRWFSLFNRIVARLRQRYPKVKYSSIAYHGYITPPKKGGVDADFIEYCLSDCCWVHPFPHDCELNRRSDNRTGQWKRRNIPMGIYGYEMDIFSQPLSYPLYFNVQAMIRKFYRAGCISILPEGSITASADQTDAAGKAPEEKSQNVHRLLYWVYAQLMLDPDREVKDLIREFITALYGEEGAPMIKYHLRSAEFWNGCRSHVISHYGNKQPVLQASEWLNAEHLRELYGYLNQTESNLKKQPPTPEREDKLNQLLLDRRLLDRWALYVRQQLPDQFAAATTGADASGGIVPGLPETSVRWDREALTLECPVRILPLTVVLGNPDPNPVRQKRFTAAPDGKIRFQTADAAGNLKDIETEVQAVIHDRRATIKLPWQLIGGIPPRSLDIAKLCRLQGVLGSPDTPTEMELWNFSVESREGNFPKLHRRGHPCWGALGFSFHAKADRNAVFYDPKKTNGAKNVIAFLERETFRPKLVHTQDELDPLLDRAELVVITRPETLTGEFWRKRLIPAMRRGLTVLAGLSGDLPLDRYFDSPDFGVERVINLKMRPSGHIDDAPIGQLKRQIAPELVKAMPRTGKFLKSNCWTPRHGFRLEQPEKWQIGGSIQIPGRLGVPFFAWRSVGKGKLALTSCPLGLHGNWTIWGNLTPHGVAWLAGELCSVPSEPETRERP